MKVYESRRFVHVYKTFCKFNDADSKTDEDLEIQGKYHGFATDEDISRKTPRIFFIIFDDMVGIGAFLELVKNTS